jgi:hypothetical protein
VKRRFAAAVAVTALAAGLVLAWPSPAGASPSVPHNATPPAGIGTGQVIVVRPSRVDLVRNKVVVRVVPLYGGAVPLEVVVRAIGDERWAAMSNGTVILKSALLQRPGTNLRVGPAVHTLVLMDSATSPAYLVGSSARIAFSGTTVVSSSGSGPATESNHRAYIRYGNGSTVSAVGATFQALGTRSVSGHDGFVVDSDSTLTAVDSSFKDGGAGLVLYHTAQASLTRISATGNAGPGVVANQARRLSLGDLNASGNTSGLVLRGPLPGLSLVGAIDANHNSAAGVQVKNLGPAPVGPLHTEHNPIGLLVEQCPGCVLVGLASSGDRRGIVISAQSAGAVVRDGTVAEAVVTGADLVAARAQLQHVDVGVADAAIGIRLAGTAQGAHVEGGTVTGGTIGVSINAPSATVDGVAVTGAATGLSVDAADATVTGGTVSKATIGVSVRAARATIGGLAVSGARVGFRVGGHADAAVLREISASNTETGLATQAGPATVTVSGLHVQQTGGLGVLSSVATLNLNRATVDGATIGLTLNAHAAVTNSTVSHAAEAVHVDRDSQVQLTGDYLGAKVLGLRIADSARVTLTDCTVAAPLGARGKVRLMGGTRFPPLPLSLLGIFALVALAAAIALEVTRKLREQRHESRVRAPAHVTNIA